MPLGGGAVWTLGVAQLLGGHDTGASAFAPARAGGLHTLAHALANDIALHLRERHLDGVIRRFVRTITVRRVPTPFV